MIKVYNSEVSHNILAVSSFGERASFLFLLSGLERAASIFDLFAKRNRTSLILPNIWDLSDSQRSRGSLDNILSVVSPILGDTEKADSDFDAFFQYCAVNFITVVEYLYLCELNKRPSIAPDHPSFLVAMSAASISAYGILDWGDYLPDDNGEQLKLSQILSLEMKAQAKDLAVLGASQETKLLFAGELRERAIGDRLNFLNQLLFLFK